MYIGVKNVMAQSNYELFLTFENGEQRIYSIKPLLNTGVFKALKDESLFKQVKLSFDTVCWGDSIDIDPERLYEDSIAVE